MTFFHYGLSYGFAPATGNLQRLRGRPPLASLLISPAMAAVMTCFPAPNVGAFGRSVTAGSLNQVISKFNSGSAGTLTPAGQALVSAGLFTPTQLQTLGVVVPTVPPAPPPATWESIILWLTIFALAGNFIGEWSPRLESLVLEPSVDILNFANKANIDPPQDALRGNLDGSQNSVNGTTGSNHSNRYRLGSGVFSVGISRAIQFGMRLTF
jgi:hypothetical protein